MNQNRDSLSQQAQKRGNRILLMIGLGLLLLFLLVLCSMQTEQTTIRKKQIVGVGALENDMNNPHEEEIDAPDFQTGTATLQLIPAEISFDRVVLGSKAEAIVTLHAENAGIKLLDKKLDKEGEFQLSGDCMVKDALAKDESCTLTIEWLPEKVQTLQNTLTFRWRNASQRAFREEKTYLPISAQSTDSKDCVICQCEKDKAPDIPREIVANKPAEIIGDKVRVGEDEYPLPDGPVVIDPVKKKIVAFVEPKKVPLSLKNELMGTVEKNNDVLDFDGNKLGRLLGDSTIVNEKFEVLGKAIPFVPAMNDKGDVIGKMEIDGKAVVFKDAKERVIGRPHIDGQVVDVATGKTIAYLSPWGMVIDFQGKVLGGVAPTGQVYDLKTDKVVGYMRPMGLALSKTGGLIGGIVPRGSVVGTACNSFGVVTMEGEVKDNLDKNIGHVLLDGTVVNSQMGEMGSVVRQGLVIDAAGKMVGFINSAGRALNFKGDLIGCVNPDGSVFSKNKFIGAVMPQGRVIREACGQVGSVYPNGQVYSDELKVVGHVYPDGDVQDESRKYLGMVAPTGTAIAPECQLLGLISPKGTVVSSDGMQVGCITRNKEVVNSKGDLIGQVTPMGILMDDQNKVSGRVGLDGHIYDAKGAVLGCVNSLNPPNMLTNRGVVINENGYATGWSFVAGKVYDSNSQWMGDVYSNGYVIGQNHQLVGYVPTSGPIFSDRGDLLGFYDQMSGLTRGLKGENLGRVLPGLTVVNAGGTEILGRLIPSGTNFVDLNGLLLGALQPDGSLMNQNKVVEAKILANGTVVDAEGKLLGAMVYAGPVLNTAGQFVAVAKQNTDVVDDKGQKIGRVLANRLAVSLEGKVLGMVFPDLSVAVSVQGNLGSVMPQGVEKNGQSVYVGKVNDAKGNLVGTVAPSGAVLGSDNSIKGHLVPLNVCVNDQGRLIGWANFSGGMNNPEGRLAGSLLPSGVSIGSAQEIQGRVVLHAVTVDTLGQFLGTLNSHGEILSNKGEVLSRIGSSDYLYDGQGVLLGRLLLPGIAVDKQGKLMGWTRFDGQIEDGKKVIGSVGLDGHVFDDQGMMIGLYLPLGETSFKDNSKAGGLINEEAQLQDASGAIIGDTLTYPFGKLSNATLSLFSKAASFVSGLNDAKSFGTLSDEGQVLPLSSSQIEGEAMVNKMVVNNTNQISGGMVGYGLATATTLGALGVPTVNGQVLNARKTVGLISGNGVVLSPSGEVMGGLFAPSILIDKKGAFAGTTGGTSGVFLNGRQIGHKLAFSSALSADSKWIGNTLPQGVVIGDKGQHLGFVTLDGSVVKNDNSFLGQILPDGSMAQVAQRGVLNTMPYGGHTVRQGLPLGYVKSDVLGRVNVMGDVVDKANQKTHRLMDSGLISGKAKTDYGRVFAFLPAIARQGEVLGMLSGNAEFLNFQGEVKGHLANDGSVEGDNKYQTLGALVPEPLVVNDCQVVGQTAYDGRVINGQGSVVGRIRLDQWAVDSQGKEIGKVVVDGPVMGPNREYLGRTLPDSTVVDVSGVEMACARNDGSIVKTDGEVIEGAGVVPPGLVFDKDGNIIGITTSRGDVIDTDFNVIGGVDGAGNAYDLNGNKIGIVAKPTQKIIFDETGKVKNLMDRQNHIYNTEGVHILDVDETGTRFTTPDGQDLGKNSAYLPGIGYLEGCDLIGFDGEKIASIHPDNTMRTETGAIYATILSDGQVFAPNGTSMGKFVGIDIDFQKCGLAAPGESMDNKIALLGQNTTVQIGPDGRVYNNDGMIIGYQGKDGRLYTHDGKIMTESVAKGEREHPERPTPVKASDDQIAYRTEIMKNRRKDMREKLGGQPALIPSPEMQARGKPKKDRDWQEKLGINKSISTWPVDMSHVILQGKAIPAVLARPIDSRFPDSPALAIVDTNIYGEEGRNILIPAGSRLIGDYQGDQGADSVAKIQITWNRLIRPDGSAFDLGGAASGDAMGRGGVAAYLDKELWNKYANPVLANMANSFIISVNTGNGQMTSNAQTGEKTTSEKAQGREEIRQSWIDLSEEILDQMIADAEKMPPVLYVPSGTRFVVFVKEDLWLRSVEDDEDEADAKFGEQSTEAQRPTGMSEPADVRQKRQQGALDRADNANATSGTVSVPAGDESPTLYNGQEVMPYDINDRVVTPVTPTQTSQQVFY